MIAGLLVNTGVGLLVLFRTNDDLEKLKKFIASLKNVEKVEILPYHNLGKFKWEELKVPYELEDVKMPSNEEIARAKEILGIL